MTLLPYCVALIAQMVIETAFMKKGGQACIFSFSGVPGITELAGVCAGSPLWPQVPQAFQAYRMGQLARGLWFAHHLTAPLCLVRLLQYLLILWAVNFGSGKELPVCCSDN